MLVTVAHYSDIQLVITHYNITANIFNSWRSLRRLLTTFKITFQASTARCSCGVLIWPSQCEENPFWKLPCSFPRLKNTLGFVSTWEQEVETWGKTLGSCAGSLLCSRSLRRHGDCSAPSFINGGLVNLQRYCPVLLIHSREMQVDF